MVDEVAATDDDALRAMPVARQVVTSRVYASILLAFALFALTFAMDERGFLGTDTGGKVVTIEQMIERGDWRSDVGYWAGEYDPEGDLHPLYYTRLVGDQWVNATSLPMLLAARPLYQVGGYRLALLLPIAGTVGAALAAYAMAERIRGGRGPHAFWLVGLASPLTIYALDLWEHSIGAALVAWAVVLAMDSLRRPPILVGLAMGGLFGVAATMRTEAYVYGAVVVGGTALYLLVERRRVIAPLLLGVSAALSLAVVTAANAALESALMGGSYRSSRAAGTAANAVSDIGLRLKEALITGVGMHQSTEIGFALFGLMLLGVLIWLMSRGRDDRATALLAVAVGLLYMVRLALGLGFVPGLVAAAPVAAVALVKGLRSSVARLPLLLALAALPLVWMFQFTGGAAPQWGGRYILPSMVVLVAIGAALLSQVGVIARRTVVVTAVVITVFGVAWTSQRTHLVAAQGERIVTAVDDGALISDVAFWLRELGAFYEPNQPWLTAQGESARGEAVHVLEQAGFDEFDVLHLADRDAPEIPGYAIDGAVLVGGLPDVPFVLSHYVAE